MIDFLFASHGLSILARGLLSLGVLVTPLNIFVAIMGGGSPGGSFWRALLTVFGMEAGAVAAMLIPALLLNALLAGGEIGYSYFGLGLGALLLVVGFNIWGDNLFQWGRGNYMISVYGWLGLCAFWCVAILGGRFFGGRAG